MEAARKAEGKPPKGNPMFKMPSDQELEKIASEISLGVTDEDLALDRELEEMAKQNQAPKGVEDVPVVELKKDRPVANLMEGDPVTSHSELLERIHLAKVEGYDSIEASADLIKQLFRRDFDYIKTETGYGIYNDIRVYIAGYFDKNKNADKVSMEEKLHKK
jgi:glutaredoxin